MSVETKELLNAPIFFEKNRVGRVYTGGALFAQFFGDNSTDSYEPEEWIASSVKAINKVCKTEKEGVSKIRNTDVFFDTLLAKHKTELLGDRESFGVLTKVLDSAIRLPVQAHPDKAFSREHLGSDYGKAESWIVLATRPDACIYFGFKRQISAEEFKQAVAESKTDKTAMEQFLNRIPVKTGDAFFVPARMVHAIGKGCLILEIQEPTDFTIQPEYYCGDYRLNDEEMYIGLDFNTAISVFDFTFFGEEAINKGRKNPVTVSDENGVKTEDLITYEDTPCFAVKRYTLNEGSLALKHKPAVYVVTDGNGTILCNGNQTEIKKGDYFFLPHIANDTVINGSLEIIACLPPKK